MPAWLMKNAYGMFFFLCMQSFTAYSWGYILSTALLGYLVMCECHRVYLNRDGNDVDVTRK